MSDVRAVAEAQIRARIAALPAPSATDAAQARAVRMMHGSLLGDLAALSRDREPGQIHHPSAGHYHNAIRPPMPQTHTERLEWASKAGERVRAAIAVTHAVTETDRLAAAGLARNAGAEYLIPGDWNC